MALEQYLLMPGYYDISVEYDDLSDDITRVFVEVSEDVRVTLWDAAGVQKWSSVITAGSHEYTIPPGQLKRYADMASLRIEAP